MMLAKYTIASASLTSTALHVLGYDLPLLTKSISENPPNFWSAIVSSELGRALRLGRRFSACTLWKLLRVWLA
jgi:hypothetical protein